MGGNAAPPFKLLGNKPAGRGSFKAFWRRKSGVSGHCRGARTKFTCPGGPDSDLEGSWWGGVTDLLLVENRTVRGGNRPKRSNWYSVGGGGKISTNTSQGRLPPVDPFDQKGRERGKCVLVSNCRRKRVLEKDDASECMGGV